MRKALALAVSIGLLVGCFATLGHAEEASTQEGPVYGKKVGDLSQPVKIKNAEGKEIDTHALAKDANKSGFVFVNAVCSLCRKEMQQVLEAKDKFPKGAKIYLVAVDMSLARSEAVYGDAAKAFTLLHDPEFNFASAVGVKSTPSSVVIDKDGKIAFVANGYDKDTLKNFAGALK